jgi:hypothetical protein
MRWKDRPLPLGSICKSTTVVLTAFVSGAGSRASALVKLSASRKRMRAYTR